jgi:nicotinate phosphoribosyltransferase
MILNSILDTDWYKLTMGQVVYFFFRGINVRYKFINRNNTPFPDGFDKLVQEEVNNMVKLQLTVDERKWLESNPNIYPSYLDWLFSYQYDPKEVKISQKDGQLEITIEGPWERTIYWEVPLLSIISELYHKDCKPTPEWQDIISSKGSVLEFPFADFGTRRRFSYEVQNFLVSELKGVCNNKRKPEHQYFLGTSNPHFAMKYNIPVIGTYAHEAVMAMEVIENIEGANWTWLSKWKMVYGKHYNIALSDTLTTEYFLKQMPPVWGVLLDGIRQDSGDPIEIGNKIIKRWEELKINPKIKKIIFSDNLTPDKAQKIYDTFKDITNPVFGIGTNLTNDCGYPPLNMVIKMSDVFWRYVSPVTHKPDLRWIPVVKLSDDKGKYTGDINTIERIKKGLTRKT